MSRITRSINTLPGAGSRSGASGWLTPSGGNTVSTDTPPTNWTQATTILWSGGPEVGKAVYQASPDFIWSLKVNVVQVSVTSLTGQEPLRAGHNCYGTAYPTTLGYDAAFACSGGKGGVNRALAMEFTAEVDLRGPGPGDGRGIRFINGGFVQVLTTPLIRAHYKTDVPGCWVASDLEGESHRDGSYSDVTHHDDGSGSISTTPTPKRLVPSSPGRSQEPTPSP